MQGTIQVFQIWNRPHVITNQTDHRLTFESRKYVC